MQTVIIDRVEGLLRTGLEEWAGRRGLDGPRGLSLSAPPAHIPADLSTSFPFQAAKQARTAPVKVAEELAESLRALFVTDASTGYSPPGFLNLTLTDSALGENLAALLADPQGYAKAPGAPPPPTLFEFVSANPTGPLHMASGRAATLGDALVRIHRRLGWKADAEYYVNDEGRQVQLLGQSLKARFLQHRGREASVPEGGYQGEYLRAMAREIPEDAEGWPDERFRAHAVERLLAAHREDMEAFQVRFDRWARESELHRSGAIPKTLEALKGKGLVHEKEGAVWFGLASEGADDKDRVLVRSDGRPTYFLADIAYHHDKLQRGYGRLVDIWGADHHGYVPRMRAAVDALGRPGSFVPVIHQLVHLFRGREAVRMSKRAGEFVTLRELVEEVGRDGCRFFFAMRTPDSHLNFDLELAKKRSQENPVFYVQYVHARIQSIFSEALKRGLDPKGPAPSAEHPALLSAPEERALLLKLAWYPRVLRQCASELTPHHLTTYLLELAGLFHPFYEKHRVADESAPGRSLARLALCSGIRQVIAEGLDLLGVSAPERM